MELDESRYSYIEASCSEEDKSDSHDSPLTIMKTWQLMIDEGKLLMKQIPASMQRVN